MEIDYDNDTWKVIDTFFNYDRYYLTKHHLDSYDDFIRNKIPQTFKQYNPQILYKEFDKEINGYKYEKHIYYGGKDSDKIYIGNPVIVSNNSVKKMYPNEARLRNLTYASHIYCDIYIEYFIGKDRTKVTKNFEKVCIGKIPIMLHSKMCILNERSFDVLKNMGECPYDQGGYFIIDGQEKVIVSHERKAENKLYIVKAQEDMFSYSAQIKSIPDNSFKYARTTVVNIHEKTGIITVRLPSIKTHIPLFVLFRALGIESDKEILSFILYELKSEKAELFMEFLRASIEDVGPIYSQHLALKYLAPLTMGNSISHLLDIINTDVFPHMGDNRISKAYYLGYVVNKLLCVQFGIDTPTDRDSFVYKRVDLSGFLLASLFRENFKQFQRDSKIEIDSKYRFNSGQYQDLDYANIINEDNIKEIFNQNVIEKSMMKAFKIGTILNKKGLIQSLNRLSNVGAISHLRRINTYGDNIMIGQRKLHPTQYGIICPVETPDGGNIGIKKHLTVSGHITFGCDPEPIVNLLKKLGMISLDNLTPMMIEKRTKIFINGKWLGIHQEPKLCLEVLKGFRRNGYINIFTSIFWDIKNMEISILTDGGRCCRPLYIMDNDKLMIKKEHIEGLKTGKITWDNLIGGFAKSKVDYYKCDITYPENLKLLDLKNVKDTLNKTTSIIEFLDTDEMGNVLLETNINNKNRNKNCSHCEIHPSLIMGMLGFTIPYVNTSQAPRNVYGTGQTKQSVGVYTSNFRNRFETSAHVLYYPQKPLITTRLSKYGFIDKLPTGINAIVAIGSYTGYNQDDSVIINKSSLERGVFNSCYFKTYDDKEITDPKNNIDELFYNPNNNENDDVKKKNNYNYSKVDKNGRAKEGDYVSDNDVIISKYSQNGSKKTDHSTVIKKDGYGVVDKVFCDNYNSNEQKITRVRICTSRLPTLGDKFASRHGQKGVIGMIIPQEDMPYSKNGIVPDIIINPHAIPSRMTLGQLVECVAGKCAALKGFFLDATPFTNIDNNEIYNLMEKCDYSRYGDELLYSGISGKQLKTKIFIGPTYYQRLKHMVKDKINSRAEGAMTLKTRQPPSGRAMGGGLRIGEMERDAILAHGTAQFLKETMYDRSDAYETYISSYSGMTSIVNKQNNTKICPSTNGPLEFDDMNLTNKNSSCDIVKVKIPFNTNLMIQECNAMGISMRLVVEDKPKYKKLEFDKKDANFKLQDTDKRIKINKKTPKKNKIPKNYTNDTKFFDKLSSNKIIIGNLPENIKKEDLRKLVEMSGEVYEIKLNIRKREALIVYTKDLFANEAINSLNNSFLDNSRLTVNKYTGKVYDFQTIDSLSFGYGMPDYGDGKIHKYDYVFGAMDDEQLEYVPTTPDEYVPTTPDEYVPTSPRTPDTPDTPESPESPGSPDYSVAAYEKKYGKIEDLFKEDDKDTGLPDLKGGSYEDVPKNVQTSSVNQNNITITKLDPEPTPVSDNTLDLNTLLDNSQNSPVEPLDSITSFPEPISFDIKQPDTISETILAEPPSISSENQSQNTDIVKNITLTETLSEPVSEPSGVETSGLETNIEEIQLDAPLKEVKLDDNSFDMGASENDNSIIDGLDIDLGGLNEINF